MLEILSASHGKLRAAGVFSWMICTGWYTACEDSETLHDRTDLRGGQGVCKTCHLWSLHCWGPFRGFSNATRHRIQNRQTCRNPIHSEGQVYCVMQLGIVPLSHVELCAPEQHLSLTDHLHQAGPLANHTAVPQHLGWWRCYWNKSMVTVAKTWVSCTHTCIHIHAYTHMHVHTHTHTHTHKWPPHPPTHTSSPLCIMCCSIFPIDPVCHCCFHSAPGHFLHLACLGIMMWRRKQLPWAGQCKYERCCIILTLSVEAVMVANVRWMEIYIDTSWCSLFLFLRGEANFKCIVYQCLASA